ncbi:MAG: hypothetical protein HYV09_29990 [Deltaproteobacteria bacterium]|nr:hypothetical protein [Deltaproteobacteria bacterium]
MTTGGCSCDLVTTAPVDRRLRGHERRQRLAGAAIAGVAVRRDVRELLASVAELGRPVAIVIHTYGGTLDERFTLTAGARWTPDEMRSNDTHFTPDTTCIVRVIAGYHRSS